jgi:uncharacterized SAM-dependent methyltransferase
MHLVSIRRQVVRIGDTRIRFAAGETIHTENSYKYDAAGFARVAAAAGLRRQRTWLDDERLFAVELLVG